MKIDLNLQEGQSGDWKLSKFSVSENEARLFNIHCAINGYPQRGIQAGEYWKLTRGGTIVMSNTPAEILDHIKFIQEAQGKVLIAGLGLGMVLQEVLKKDSVIKVTVVEISKDVINLVAKSYQDPRLEIINEDIFNFKPTEHYDFGWYDIWDDISGDEYEEMKKITRKLSRFVSKSDCWCKNESKKRAKHEAYSRLF